MPEVPEALKHSDRPSARCQSAWSPADEVDQDVPEVGVEVPVHRVAHRFEHLGVHVGRPGAAQEPFARLQRRDAGDERLAHVGPSSRGPADGRARSLNGRSKEDRSMA